RAFWRVPSPESRVPASQKGFTLLEVLAAIALLAFAFAIGLRAMSGALGNGARGEAMTQAALEAQSLLDMQGLDTALSPGVQQGRFPDGANWSLRTSVYRPPVESANPASAFSTPQSVSGEEDSANPRGSGIDLFRLELDVRYAGSHTLHLSTLKAQLAQQR
ncbi:MAG TPA: prepilin-type N-terminal cleavage/methylation domain-containing protein, partial [Rhodanobacteraceae bacterium]|nr:prepilin-type N-terminal cleavage/methylation domain-containing protein [Rhodanobacteraceae bacterium]